MPRFRKLPVIIEAIKWEGFNYDEVVGFAPLEFVTYDYRGDYSLQLWNTMEECWVKCPPGHWIIKGIKGEIYPCDSDVFEQTYEPAD